MAKRAFERIKEGLEEAKDRVQTGSFIHFNEQPHLDRRPHKTRRRSVTSLYGDPLGQIKWWSPWRRYCFFPNPDTVFEQVCMREIADFVENKTREHKATVANPASD